jgi:hypothetical protein
VIGLFITVVALLLITVCFNYRAVGYWVVSLLGMLHVFLGALTIIIVPRCGSPAATGRRSC